LNIVLKNFEKQEGLSMKKRIAFVRLIFSLTFEWLGCLGKKILI